MPEQRKRWYVGIKKDGYFAFPATKKPTQAAFGKIYIAVIGPFDTKRAALWAEKYGSNNPHFQTVRDAERISKKKQSVMNVRKYLPSGRFINN